MAGGDISGVSGKVIDAKTKKPLQNAIASIQTPVIEVHISNIHAREDFRKISHVSAKVVGSIVGLGLKGYHLATTWFVDQAASKS